MPLQRLNVSGTETDEEMAVAAPERPVPPRPPKPPRSLWQPRNRQDREYAIEQYCRAEAEREVEAMLAGRGYVWRAFDERDWNQWDDLRLLRPLELSVKR